MAITYPNGATLINIMADGSECDDVSTYLKSPDQLSGLTQMLLARIMRKGIEINEKVGATCIDGDAADRRDGSHVAASG